MSNGLQNACARALQRELGDRVWVDASSLERCAWDYGRMIHRTPAVVVSVHSADELVAVLLIGAEHAMPICTRGSGHSMSGQCLAHGALVIDMKGWSSVQVDAERGSAWLSGGATWHRGTNAAFAEGLMPLGLTTIVDTTVGGTLSVGGIGAESFRTGTQADQVRELDVATLDGQVLRCSAEQNKELFDAARAGVGQCGVIVKARYPLRKPKAKIRTYTLACPDGRALIADMRMVGRATRLDFMMGALIWNEQHGWQQLLLLGKEHDDPSELNDSALLAGLQSRELARADTPLWQLDGRPGHPFIRLFEEQNKLQDNLHRPWVDHLCEPHAADELLSAVLAEPMVAARARTSGVVLGVAAHPNRAPLLRPPAQGPLFLLGLSPEAPPAQLPAALAYLRRHNRRGAAVGGKRYLSGFLEGWSAHEWASHFGDSWPRFQGLKERFDPRGLLNNGQIRWR